MLIKSVFALRKWSLIRNLPEINLKSERPWQKKSGPYPWD